MTLNRGAGDPGDENDARADCDGTCVYCIEARTRPAVANLEPIEAAPDEVHLAAGMNALGWYIKEQEHDGDYAPLAYLFYDIEMQGLTLLRSKLLRKAINAEAEYHRPIVSGSGESGVL